MGIVVWIAFTVGMILYILPWPFILQWVARVVAWVVFGPHMKLVDYFWFSKRNFTEREKIMQRQAALNRVQEQAQKAAHRVRLRKEEAMQVSAMKSEIFGKFLTKVPVLRMERFLDYPMSSSKAEPFKRKAG